MFHSARIKLTAWYLTIIMFVSISFSAVIYRAVTHDIERFSRSQRAFIERRIRERELFPGEIFNRMPVSPTALTDPELVNEITHRLLFMLVMVNGAIFIVAGGLGYMLAGRTLAPIQDMVNEQKRFVADASHELRTPLTNLKSEIEVNLRDKKLSFDQAKKLLRSNLEEVNNLQVLSDDLIKLTQFDRSVNNTSIDTVSLSTVVSEAIKKVMPLAKTKEISIKNKTASYTFEGSKTSLVELFVILLDNAIKYSPQKREITISSKKTDGTLLVQVIDQGIGIDSKDIPYLFDRFWRVDKSRTKSTVSGYGLGLSIAKQIVDRHNGTVSAASNVGKGTTFTIRLPLKHRSQTPAF